MKLRFCAVVLALLTMQLTAQAKPLLLFEIDEGFKDSLMGQFKNDPEGLKTALKNMRSGLVPLTKKYEVAVLVYPGQTYKESGTGLDRVEPVLKQLFDFFERPEPGQPLIGVYLEAYSSGNATQQDGALDRRPIPHLGVGANDKPRLGLSMDLVTLGALRDAYPKSFQGLRFHEVYGSDIAWKVRPEGQKYGFVNDPEVIRAVVDLCAQKKMRLVWSDSNWLMKSQVSDQPHYTYDKINRPYIEMSPFASLQEEAEAKLGELLCFSWANNNYHFTPNLEYLSAKIGPSEPGVSRPVPGWIKFDQPFKQFALKGRPKAKWGMSIQGWFWHELSYTLTGRYYFAGEIACPVEVLEAYSKKGLREGASVLQFEPSWYFFNEDMPGKNKSRSTYEKRPDYSPRVALKRLTETLLNPEKSEVPDRLEPIFDPNQQKFHENDFTAPPLNYADVSVNLLSKNSVAAYVGYSFAPKLKRQAITQWPSDTFRSDAKFIRRVEVDGDGIDEVLIADAEKMNFINQHGGTLDVAFPKTEAPIGIASANLVQNIVGPGDPDEIVVASRKGSSTQITLQVYVRDAEKGYVPLEVDRNRALLLETLGTDSLDPKTYVGLASIRKDARIYSNGARSLDSLVVLQRDAKKQLQVRLKDSLVPVPGIPGTAQQVEITPIDDALSGRDSLLITWRLASSQDLHSAIYRLSGSTLSRSSSSVFPAQEGRGVSKVFALRKRILINGGVPR